MSRRFFGTWEDEEDVAQDFQVGISEVQGILLAHYDFSGYEGAAFVLFERDGKLYEVNGSHCSCYGLERQWEPEETSWDALKFRSRDGRYIISFDDDGAEKELQRLIAASGV